MSIREHRFIQGLCTSMPFDYPGRITRLAAGGTVKLFKGLVVAITICSGASCYAEDKGPVLRKEQVTENVLIDALIIEGPEVPASGATRGFGIVRPMAKPKIEGGGRASLLMTFDTDSAELSDETMKMLDTVAKALQSDQLAGFAFRIEGHADPRGGAELNQQLSARRAAAVARYLVEHHGILSERLSPVGKGASELMDTKNPNSSVNRRVTIVTLKG